MTPSSPRSQSGLTCSGQVCEALCTIDTLEPYCDAALPCNEALGYTCYKNRCRPPSGAIRVQLEEPCDQGSGNTRFWCAVSLARRSCGLDLTLTLLRQHSRQRHLRRWHLPLVLAARLTQRWTVFGAACPPPTPLFPRYPGCLPRVVRRVPLLTAMIRPVARPRQQTVKSRRWPASSSRSEPVNVSRPGGRLCRQHAAQRWRVKEELHWHGDNRDRERETESML